MIQTGNKKEKQIMNFTQKYFHSASDYSMRVLSLWNLFEFTAKLVTGAAEEFCFYKEIND